VVMPSGIESKPVLKDHQVPSVMPGGTTSSTKPARESGFGVFEGYRKLAFFSPEKTPNELPKVAGFVPASPDSYQEKLILDLNSYHIA